MTNGTGYAYLGPKPGSLYRQFFVQGPYIRAETLYRATLGPDAKSAEDVASDFGVPVEAVRESIRYCLSHEDLLREECEQDRQAAESYRPATAGASRRTP